MANPAKHDRQDVIRKATLLFWEKGFHATSMRNLQEHIDMRPGSIYATFGSKEGLFKEALQCFANSSIRRLEECRNSNTSSLEALKQFVKEIVFAHHETAPNEMCMLVKTVSELTEDNAELLAEAKRLLLTMEDAFSALIAQAQQQGELDKTKDPRRLARFLQMQLIGLRVYSRADTVDSQVNELIDDAFACFN